MTDAQDAVSEEARLDTRRCLECGKPVAHAAAEFCCTPCRKDFNNRRMQRGAELYDMFMALRYERGLAYGLGVWTLICRSAQAFRREDQRQRCGRRSWKSPKEIIQRKPHLKSVIVSGSSK